MKCIKCGCTDEDCGQCVAAQGEPCHWVADGKCSRCFDDDGNAKWRPEDGNATEQWLWGTGMREDFEAACKKKGTAGDDMESWWLRICKWAEKYLQLLGEIVPAGHVESRVETRQQYEDFSLMDILTTLSAMGRIARHLYTARNWVFEVDHTLRPEEYDPMGKHYYYVLEGLAWQAATFVAGTDYSLTTMHDRLAELFAERAMLAKCPVLGDWEKMAIRQALTESGSHKRKAAELLGISPAKLRRRMDKYDLDHVVWNIERHKRTTDDKN